ncbi:MAG: hypothetical protein N2654_05165 [Deltaproteobacteria bacterium]|nr:hypothetical protein [Deltaproteobacteria bacterium]
MPYLILVLNFIGLVLSIFLYAQESGANLPFCELGQKFSCAAVLSSPYAKLFGIPNSLVGIWFYAFVMLLFVGLSKNNSFCLYAYVLMSLISVLFSLYLAYASIFEIGYLCPYCVGTYIINVANLILSVIALKKRDRYDNSVMPVFLSFLLSVTITFILATGISLRFETVEIDSILVKSSEEPLSPLPDMIKNRVLEDHKKLLIEFVDPVCPGCLRWKQVSSKVRDKIKTLYFPLDKECNPAIPHDFHKNACFLSRVLICAEKFSTVNEITNYLNKNVSDHKQNFLENAVSLLQKEFPKEFECSQSVEAATELSNHIQLGLSLKIVATPTIYYKGFFVDFSRVSPEIFVKLLILDN